MPPIRKLDPSLVNKIAAGEVIERPASVVKELIENALDAGASRIDVDLQLGGTALIRVTDNGGGVAGQDLPLAVSAHATSKLQTADDLFAIRTLGFRGEALASIASVSHLRICSRTADAIEAHELSASDGQVAGPRPCAAPVGTTVEVRNLFHNVPARRKFLRRDSTEFAHVTEQIARPALAHPRVAFSVTHNDRPTRSLPPASDRRGRIADFYGAELAECLLAVDRQEHDLRIEALIAPPAHSRASSKWQYIFLNGRYILDRRIGFAIREAFRGLVEHDRYPVAFIFLTADPSTYDVNVHPTKIEVRWRDAGQVQSQVLAVLRETLLACDLTPRLGLQSSNALGASSFPGESSDGGPREAIHQERARQALADYLKSIEPTQARLGFRPPPFPSDRIRPSIGGHARPAFDSPAATDGVVDRAAEGPATEEWPRPVAEPAFSAPVLQVHNTYIVAQTEDGMVIIDQHALHERILYEKFRERILAGPLESQRLLMPQTIEASPAAALAAQQHGDFLRTLGIELTPFGPQTLACQSFPILLDGVEVVSFVGDLLDALADAGEGQSAETLVHGALDLMACKAAVKAGDPLTTDEMHALLAQRHLTDRSSNCPHGRPTTLQLTTRDLERQFKRT